MQIIGLGYIGLASARLREWEDFATTVIGAEIAEKYDDGRVRLRIDDHLQRVILRPSSEEGVDYVGWELPSGTAFRDAVRELETAEIDHEVVSGARALDDRNVSDYAAFRDPAGNAVEVFWGPKRETTPFVSKWGCPFVTGDLGLGHVFFVVENFDATQAFYESLGFRESDRIGAGAVRFYRCNPRQHSIALGAAEADSPYPPGLGHFMLQLADMDAVGRAYDLCLDGAAPLATTLGRHANDRVFSFYVTSPSGWDMELGSGGIRVDESTWSVAELDVESLWGHRPITAAAASAGGAEVIADTVATVG